MTFFEGLVDLFSSPVALAALLILTCGFGLTVALSFSPKARSFMSGVLPFVRPKDEKGNPTERSTAQWVCMMALICLLVLLITL
jgi:hypothetical protein